MNIVTYDYGGGLYLNLTNRCDCACVFCVRNNGEDGSVHTGDLWLDREPSRQEVLDEILARDLGCYSELVFCGFGEPTCRADDLLWLCDRLREIAPPGLPGIRLNTNGHGSLLSHRDLPPELKGRLDAVSVSLNASNETDYLALTRPVAGGAAWRAMLDFVRDCTRYVPSVAVTVVDYGLSDRELAACARLASSLGAEFRVRPYAAD